MAAVIFPQENATNPVTGRPYNEGWLNPDNNIIYVYENGAWKTAGAGEPNAVLDSFYVEVDGDNMTGPLTLGGDKITLNATDGSVSFAGNVNIGSQSLGSATGAAGILEVADGRLYTQIDGASTANTVDALRIYHGSTPTTTVRADGSASFAGSVVSGGDPTSGANNGCALKGASGLQATGNAADSYLFRGWQNGSSDITSSIKADGSAIFAGDVTVGKTATDPTTARGIRIKDAGAFNYLISNDVQSGGGVSTVYQHLLNGDQTLALNGDGSAKFAGDIVAGEDPNVAGTPVGVVVKERGQIVASRATTNPIWTGYQNGNDDFTSLIRADGSGVFMGNVGFGTTTPLSTTGYIGPTASGSSGGVYWMAKNSGQVGYLAGTTNEVTLAATETGGGIRFLTGGNNEKVRIDSTGRTTCYGSDAYISVIRSSLAPSRSSALLGCTAGNSNINGAGDGTLRFQIFTNGDAENVNGVFAAISDATLKENIVPATSQWSDVKDIEIVNYNFKEETGHETHKQLGVIAQQVEEVCPGLVNTNEEGLKSVSYSVLYMKSVKALQEAIARIESLEESNANLLERISALEAQ